MAKKSLPETPGLLDDLPEDTPKEQIAKITLKGWRDHLASFSALERKIEGLLDDAVKQTLAKGGKLTQDDIGRVFQRHPEMRRDLEKAMQTLNKRLTSTIEEGSKEAWLRANATGNEVALALAANNAQLAALLADGQDKPQNDRALQAFMKRKEAGMNLSDRVWKTTMGMKLDMERAIDVALAEGMSADRLSLKIRELLREPHRLYRRVRDKDGNLRLSQAAQKYHPGTGVYRSSYKNAMRVARTEVNMAYQASDNERWTNSWWIRGIRVSLSNNHTTTNSKGEKEPLIDICDELRGDYPPDFKFIGWHPQCRCFAAAITVDYDEIRDYYRRKRAGEDMSNYKPKGLITDVPMQFKNWMERNADRLAGAAERGTTPYFIKENPKYTDPGWKPAAPPKPTIQQRMDERHAKRTPADIEKIQKAWDERKARIEAEKTMKPPHHEDYKPHAEGMVMVSPLHNKSELKENLKLAETLSRAIGSKVYLLPEINPEKKGADALRKEYLPAETKKGKNPDFMGGGKLWDGKTASFKNTPNERAKVKATIENHIKKAKQQADNFIIEIPERINQKWVDEAVTNYLKFSSIDRTIIIRRPDGTFKTYKK